MQTILKRLGQKDRQAIRQVLNIYHDVDKETLRFAHLTHISCPPRCGLCCQSPKVEASVLEMLPLAAKLWSEEKGMSCLENIEKKHAQKRCFFFDPDPQNTLQGRCGAYQWRPLICRLFGFSLNKNKYGSYAYSGCKTINHALAEGHFDLTKLTRSKIRLTTMANFTMRLSGISTSRYDTKPLAINMAIKFALEKIGFELEKHQWKCRIKQ